MASYDSQTKEQLLAEVSKRKEAGRTFAVNQASTKSDIIEALEDDDGENPASESVEKTPEQLHNEAVASSDGVLGREVPADLNEYTGKYRYKVEPGKDEYFGLKVLDEESARSRKTHLLKSPFRFWEGTEEEFKAQFDEIR